MIQREAKLLNDLNYAFFPVEERAIYLDSEIGSPKRRIPGYKAIVDVGSNRALSVVSDKYRLVTNPEAYEMADFVVRAIFEGKTLNDFVCFNVHMSKTKGSCRIDLIIPNNFNKLFGQETESWTPFVRISNSYNRTMVLKYEIGFCRWICLNGVIFGQTGITFTITHLGRITYKEIDILINRAKRNIGDIGSLWKAFENKMTELKTIRFPLSLSLALYCKVFEIEYPEENNSWLTPRVSLSAEQVQKSSREYFRELGDNAYAMMNVLTDYASFPEWTNNRSYIIHGYQKRVGKWVDDFITEHNKEGFVLSDYIEEKYKKTANELEKILAK